MPGISEKGTSDATAYTDHDRVRSVDPSRWRNGQFGCELSSSERYVVLCTGRSFYVVLNEDGAFNKIE